MASAKPKYESKREHMEILRVQLDTERQARIPLYRDLADYILPWVPQFNVTDVKKGDRRSHKIYDTTGTLSHRTLEAGMMGGLSSPARPWFALATEQSDLNEVYGVKSWLERSTKSMLGVFGRSNLYPILSTVYGDLGVFATGAMFIEEDMERVIHCTHLPPGSYMIGSSGKGRVDILFRVFPMTVRQIVEKFGRDEGTGEIDWAPISSRVKNLWMEGQREQWIEVCHVVRPNDEYLPGSTIAKYQKYESCYYERGSIGGGGSYLEKGDEEKYLREDGYDYFPALVPRWKVSGSDVYGSSSPGIEALADIKQLQVGEKKALKAIDKMVDPPMVGPSVLQHSKSSILPGDVTFIDERDGMKGFRPAHEVRFSVQENEIKQAQVRTRISKAFYEDLFLMMANSDRAQITAREIEERHEEKLLVLGPVLERLNQDLFDPLIDLTFNFMLKQGRLPDDLPEELQGVDLKVDYISIMAQAQKMGGVSKTERFTGFLAQVAPLYPEIVDKVNPDKLAESYGEDLSIDSSIFRSDEDVEKIRGDRARRAQAEQQAAIAQQGAQAAKVLSETDVEGNNALTGLMRQHQAGQVIQ